MELARLNRWTRVMNILAFVSLIVAMGTIFFYAPVEQTMGNVQRIFYFHVGSAWVGSVAFLVALIGGVLFLWRPDRKWDTMTTAAVEIGLVFLQHDDRLRIGVGQARLEYLVVVESAPDNGDHRLARLRRLLHAAWGDRR